jgi:hypothetical protein
VMNHIKNEHPWIDLLKPETAGILKILRAFGAVAPLDGVKALREATRMAERWLQYDADGLPTDEEYVNARSAALGYENFEAEFVSTAKDAPRDELDDLMQAAKVELSAPEILKAFRHRAKKDATTFNVDIEAKTYLRPANTLARRHKVVIFGHTHLAKALKLENEARYLNTGTWADLIRVPESVFTGPEAKALADLKPFVEALRTKNIEQLRRQVATYARVDLDSKDKFQDGGMFFFDGAEQADVPLTTDGMLKRLDVKA